MINLEIVVRHTSSVASALRTFGLRAGWLGDIGHCVGFAVRLFQRKSAETGWKLNSDRKPIWRKSRKYLLEMISPKENPEALR